MLELLAGRRLDASIIQIVNDVTTDVGNRRSAGYPRSPIQSLREWAVNTEQRLRNVVSGAELRRLVYTERYWHALTVEVAQAEIDDAHFRWTNVGTELTNWRKRWAEPSDSVIVVPDTSVILRSGSRLVDIEWFRLVGAAPDDAIRVVFPLVVLDELENLKDRGDNRAREGQAEPPRVTARKALRDLAGWFSERRKPTHPTQIPVSYIALKPSVEALEDPPGGHVRYPRADDELIRRAVQLRDTSGQRVVLLTYDVAMSTRAQIEELNVVLHDGDGGAISSMYI